MDRNVAIITPETEGKVFPWLVVVLVTMGGKIILEKTGTGRYTLPKKFGGSFSKNLELSYEDTVKKIFEEKGLVANAKVEFQNIINIKNEYRGDLSEYKKVFIKIDLGKGYITLPPYCHETILHQFFPEEISGLYMFKEERVLALQVFNI